jgi:sugar lactone lactonase YvrE
MSDEEMTTGTLATGIYFGEAPRWHEGRLWFSDFHARAVKSVAMDGRPRIEVGLDDMPSGLGWLPDGTLLVVSMDAMNVLRRNGDGTLSVHGDLTGFAEFRANDMVVAPDGSAYVGNFGFDLDHELEARGVEWVIGEAPATTLAYISPEGVVTKAADGLRFPNGMVISPDGATLIVAETISMRLTAFDRAPDGALSNRRVFAELPGIPADGICLDANGCVWVANPFGTDLVCVADGGAIVNKVVTSMPSYACALGGPNGKTLFAMTAPTSNFAIAAAEPLGCIETASVDIGAAV